MFIKKTKKMRSFLSFFSLFPLLFCVSCTEAEAEKKTSLEASNSKMEEWQKKQVVGAETSSPALAAVEPSGSAGIHPGKAETRQEVSGRTLRIIGQVNAEEKSQIAFRAAGFISEVLVKAGAFVKKGEKLALLENRDANLRLNLAKTKLAIAEVSLDNAKKDFERERGLQKENVISQTALDRMQFSYDQAKLALQMAKLDQENAVNGVRDTELLAPYDCIVGSELKHTAEYVTAGQGIFEIFRDSSPDLKFLVPERMMGHLNVGDSISVLIPAVSFKGSARIARIVHVVQDKTRTFEVIAKVQGNEFKAPAGVYAEAVLTE
ncbi:MAG: efflux RND transporter periplasmic adaptor subunit [Oligoflexales bacterium]|nr:efflux RND transporter periplasmic adaptor subunit [Oligoflexales bacterium]